MSPLILFRTSLFIAQETDESKCLGFYYVRFGLGHARALFDLLALPVMGVLPGLILLTAAWAITTGFGWYLKRQLGGLNGDSYGAIGEVSEALTLVLTIAII